LRVPLVRWRLQQAQGQQRGQKAGGNWKEETLRVFSPAGPGRPRT